MSTKVQEEISFETLEKIISKRDLVVYNDDVNTFDHVIDSLIKVCKHEVEQATQCTYIIHYKGKCDVKKGTFEELKPMCESLLEKGITAEIH